MTGPESRTTGLRRTGSISLPAHQGRGGFDHAAVSYTSSRLYVAHTGNDAMDIIDLVDDRFLHAVPGLTGVAGVLVSDEDGLVFTANRGERSVGIMKMGKETEVQRVAVGHRPNGLAYDPGSRRLLVAHVGDPQIPSSQSVAVIDVPTGKVLVDQAVPGRTRWTVFVPAIQAFLVNIGDPAMILTIPAGDPGSISRRFPCPVGGPHGLDIDHQGGRIFCACDGGEVVVFDLLSGAVRSRTRISGSPDVIFFDAARQHLHVAIGDPGVIDVIDTRTMELIQSVPTQPGAHTFALDERRHRIFVFLPETHEAAMFTDPG